MAQKSTRMITEGTIIAIPLGDGRWVLSQIYRPGVSFFLLVFDVLSDGAGSDQLTTRPILGSWTNDAEIYRGNWKVLGQIPIASGIFAEPEYAIRIAGEPMVESFDGKTRRTPRRGDEGLRTRISRSPLLVQDAIRSYFGLQDWKAYYDALRLT